MIDRTLFLPVYYLSSLIENALLGYDHFFDFCLNALLHLFPLSNSWCCVGIFMRGQLFLWNVGCLELDSMSEGEQGMLRVVDLKSSQMIGLYLL